MTDISPYLNKPARSLQQALDDRLAKAAAAAKGKRQAQAIKAAVLGQTAFGRTILDEAFERVSEDGRTYRLRRVKDGAWLDELDAAGNRVNSAFRPAAE